MDEIKRLDKEIHEQREKMLDCILYFNIDVMKKRCSRS